MSPDLLPGVTVCGGKQENKRQNGGTEGTQLTSRSQGTKPTMQPESWRLLIEEGIIDGSQSKDSLALECL